MNTASDRDFNRFDSEEFFKPHSEIKPSFNIINPNLILEIFYLFFTIIFEIFGWSIVFFLGYFYIYSYFYVRGVKTVSIPLPFIGNNLFLFFGIRNPFENTRLAYNKAKNTKLGVAGWFDMATPVLSICNHRALKSTTIGKSSMENFINHREITTPKDFNIKNLFQLKGDQWKKMREVLIKSFSDVELSKLLKHLIQVSKNLEEYLLDQYESKKEKNEQAYKCKYRDGEFIMELDAKDLFSRFTNDCILTIAFGIEQNSFSDDISANENFKQGQNLTNLLSGFRWIKFYLINISHILTRIFFPSGLFAKEPQDHFIKLIDEQLLERKSGNVKREDVLQLLVDNIKEKEISDEEIYAHILIYFFAGFDSVATCLSMTALQLGENRHVQEKLVQETNRIDVYSKNETKMCFYERLSKLTYMDCVITESLRRYPVNAELDRVCTKPFTFSSTDGQSKYTIKTGQRINVPILGFHNDVQFFTQPKLFMPERHMDKDNRHRENPHFLAFGAGPRKCLGFRLARMEIKLALCSILRHFEFIPVDATPLPIELKNSFEVIPEPNGYIIGLRKRILHDLPSDIFYPTIISNEDLFNYRKKIDLEKEKARTEAEKHSRSQSIKVREDHAEKVAFFNDEQRVPVYIVSEIKDIHSGNQDVPNLIRPLNQTTDEKPKADSEEFHSASEGDKDTTMNGSEKPDLSKVQEIKPENKDQNVGNENSPSKQATDERLKDNSTTDSASEGEKDTTMTISENPILSEDQEINLEKKNEEKTENISPLQTDSVNHTEKDSSESKKKEKESNQVEASEQDQEITTVKKVESATTPEKIDPKSEQSPKTPLD